mmetsp:Transcript_16986/g.55352  ORF Transcript_16986/g.55352 Transcript_16986/m.55352 type:complete len:245 (+) Transcript_16986:319-1053(+)
MEGRRRRRGHGARPVEHVVVLRVEEEDLAVAVAAGEPRPVLVRVRALVQDDMPPVLHAGDELPVLGRALVGEDVDPDVAAPVAAPRGGLDAVELRLVEDGAHLAGDLLEGRRPLAALGLGRDDERVHRHVLGREVLQEGADARRARPIFLLDARAAALLPERREVRRQRVGQALGRLAVLRDVGRADLFAPARVLEDARAGRGHVRLQPDRRRLDRREAPRRVRPAPVHGRAAAPALRARQARE